MKKFFAILMSLALMLSLAVPAMAASVTVPPALEDHTFVAYQIFTGTQAETEGETEGALGDVAWGNGINKDAFLGALRAEATFGEGEANIFAGLTDAKAVAEKMATFTTDSTEAKLIAKLAYEYKTGTPVTLEATTNLDDGYYLIVDNTGGSINGGNSAYNAALLQVTDNITIRVKTSAPSVEKKVKENVKYTEDAGYGANYNDVADYDIGDVVPFAFYSKVPDMTYYDTYKYIFHDKMSDGLTLNEDSIVVKVDGNPLTKGTEYTVKTTELCSEDCSFEIVISDLKAIAGNKTGKDIRVDFTAVLNEDAEIGLPGNPNEVMLEYSNNPNESGEGDDHETDETPWDKVIVFTYEVDVTKVDGATPAIKLEGAKFVLMNAAQEQVAVVDATGKVTNWADVPENWESADEVEWPEGSVLISDGAGLFKVIGLDDGTYYLKETEAPAGYNMLTDEVKVVVTATTTNGQNWTDGKAETALTALKITVGEGDGAKTADGNVADGIVSTSVENNAGTVLPETGGMGTTIFYAVGGVMVAAAAILLITKKRMSAEG